MEVAKDVPTVLFSTSTLPSDAAYAKSLNAGFVTKPLSRKQIHQIFDELIEHCSDEVKKRIIKEKKLIWRCHH